VVGIQIHFCPQEGFLGADFHENLTVTQYIMVGISSTQFCPNQTKNV